MDAFESLNETLRNAAPILLAGPGIVLVLSGLFLWPGGLRFLRPLAAFFASAVGLVCAWVFTDRSLTAMLLLGLIPALIALVLDKPFVVLLGACLGGAVVLFYPLAADTAFRTAVVEMAPAFPDAEQASVLEPSEYGQRVADWASGWVEAFWTQVPDMRKIAAAGTGVVILVLGAAAWRWICALTCAALGTMLILSGLILLILSKGTQTIPYLQDKQPYFWLIVAVMLAAGTLLNRWLCPVAPKVKKDTEKHSAKGGDT